MNKPQLVSALDVAATLGMDLSVAIETFPRLWAGSTQAMTNNQLTLTYFTPLADLLISKIGMTSSAALSATSLTLLKFGLFTVAGDGSVTPVARTAHDATVFGSGNTYYEKALDTANGFPAIYLLQRGVRYASGYLIVATSIASGSVRAAGGQSGLNVAPAVCSLKAAQTDILSAVTGPTNAGPGAAPWMRLAA